MDIRRRAVTLHQNGLSEEIPFRIFNKLDQALFAVYLNNAVSLGISRLNPGISGSTYTRRWRPDPEVKRISIILNQNVRDIVATLIHHMIHAYSLVACGEQKENEMDSGRLKHGLHFDRIMLAIRRLSAAHGRELITQDYGHRLPSRRFYVDGYYRPRRRDEIELEDKNEWCCSHCHSDIHGPSDNEVEKWYKEICQPMLDLPPSIRALEVEVYNVRRHELEKRRRAHLGSSSKSVEFIFKDRPVLVGTDKINQFPSASSRFLRVPKEVSEDTFMGLLEFLHTGSYPPDPHVFAGAAVTRDARCKAPPIIKSQNVSVEAIVVLADIRLAKLGLYMGFEDCKTYALDRMNTYGVLYEDPVAVLKEIYRGCELDPDLKVWARMFLTRCLNTSSPGHYHGDLLGHSTIEPPNLLKLESQQGAYQSRFCNAIEISGALENDVNKACAELKTAGWYTSFMHTADQPARNSNNHPHTRPHFFPDSSSPSSSSSSGSWYKVRDLTSQLSSLSVNRAPGIERGKVRDGDYIGPNRTYKKMKYSMNDREEHLRDVEVELDKARENVRRLEREKGDLREKETQKQMRIQAVVLVEELLEENLGQRRGVDEY
ncbi:hypothetical protein GGP41_003685 [Bipolaris sorokiniana]|uniref:SprT-like domain-containing protein n=1 Tax=Cochliobolus sativus TaxID=45130 RepID=A0A8H6DRY0_COCSA|nr:hypothetical protein GGP41_003685 [Bipolaris sorokiniana]